ncbi:hypothetical protein GL218_09462 [Daldinia childiae]|uniref:uncharacterized protein n=1 Tax=Daldinia childiae TaxID=326645 RepID=UPI001446BA3E|nr:uncharacterized protein GL218_09462 [Daldinia childiae]KAF3062822.1 hypothetical protein GL218_09462 [Daldinia childiae]
MDLQSGLPETEPENFTMIDNPTAVGNGIFIPFTEADLDDPDDSESDEDDEDEDEDDEDVDDGEPDFAIGRSGTIDIRTERTKLLTEVSKEVRFDDADVIEKYQARVRLCLKDDKNVEEPTLLHYIVLSLLIFHETQDAMNFIVRLALQEAPEDLAYQTKGPLETPLHVAIKRKEENLAKLMCEIAPDVAAKAISLQNENGETCLHLAIKENLDVAPFLISKAHIAAFRQQRSQKIRHGAGNTPLHDAVHYSRYIVEVPTCPPEKIPKCRRCREAEKKLESSCTRLSKIVESLVQKDPEALATLNALGQSPYVYHLATRQETRASLDLAKSKPTGGTQDQTLKNPKTEGSGSAASGKIEKPNPYIKSGATIAHEERKRAKNPKSETPNIPNKGRSAKPGPKITKTHQPLPRSDKLAEKTKIEEYLREMAFAQGNFEKAFNGLDAPRIKVIESIERPPKTRITPRLDSSFDVRSQDRHHWMNNIRDFAAELRTELGVNYNQRRPKVAIIDDGVNPEGEFLGQRIAHGWPPDEPKSNLEPFYASTRGHGTQMAKLICHACPFAQLYVAKLDGWKDPDLPHPQFTAKDAAEAVKWAIRENVDIISMSWNIERSRSNEADIDALASQIKIAANRNIIMYCAAQDKGQLGNSETEVYPAGSDTTKLRIVGAADPTGHPLNIVDTNKVHYLFPGEVILENDNKAITGSSAATALAAGTAAMILFCYELGYGKMETIAKPGRMGQLFNSLKKSTKYVDVESILKPGQTPELVVKECAARVKEIRDEENLRATPDHRTSGGLDLSGSTASFAPPIRRTTGPLVVPGGR